MSSHAVAFVLSGPAAPANQQLEAAIWGTPLTHGAIDRKHGRIFQAVARFMPAVKSPAPISREPPVRLTMAWIFGLRIVFPAAAASSA